MLIDSAVIFVRAGKGGSGCLSFRRERFVPKGGPDGGDGGQGGDVLAMATPGVETLMDFTGKHHWIAPNGLPGQGRNRSGAAGDDITLQLPAGTLIYDADTGVLLKDLTELNQPVCIARGGKGGKGNARFATPTHRTPREFEPGEQGEERRLRLELKLIADVGLVGLPNAGKSTLLSRLSAARPKVADYPFTTLQPQLGIVSLSPERRFVLADIPGLIEGAHTGAGLGDAFLRHIERTRTILHVVDVGSPYATAPPVEAYHTIRRELREYSDTLASKPEVVAANKVDLTDADDAVRELADALGQPVYPISAVSGHGLPALLNAVWNVVDQGREAPAPPTAPPMRRPPHLDAP